MPETLTPIAYITATAGEGPRGGYIIEFPDGGTAAHATRADAFTHASAWFKASRYQRAELSITEKRTLTK